MKSFQMTSSPRTHGPDTPNIGHLRMNQEEVCTVNTHRHLGVQIDNHLNFQSHIETITTKFRKRVVLLVHMSSRLTPEVTHRLILAMSDPPFNTPRRCGSSNCPHPNRRSLSVCRPDWHESSWDSTVCFPPLLSRRHLCSRTSKCPVWHGGDTSSAPGSSITWSTTRPLPLWSWAIVSPPARGALSNLSRRPGRTPTRVPLSSLLPLPPGILSPLTLEPPKIVIVLCLASVPSLPTPALNPLVSFFPEFL